MDACDEDSTGGAKVTAGDRGIVCTCVSPFRNSLEDELEERPPASSASASSSSSSAMLLSNGWDSSGARRENQFVELRAGRARGRRIAEDALRR